MQNSEKKIFICTHEGCRSAFHRPYRLQQHELLHINVKPFMCTEENCTKTYTSKSHLNRHINNAHKMKKNDVIYSCPECMKKYANRQNLKRHIKRDHINITNKFLCDICKKQFKKKNQLTSHMFQHNGIKSFRCDFCPKDFITLYEKKKHVRNHKTYGCECCSVKFNQWSQYVKHKRTNSITKDYICNDCGKSFTKRAHIVRHIKTHSQVLLRPFVCPFNECERRYSRQNNLTQHIIMKHEKITHSCTICEAQLCSKASLQNHINKLHGDKGKQRFYKTIDTGRNFRRDKNSLKFIAALKLAGLKDKPTADDCNINNPLLTTNEPLLID